jgi:small conductance mechanosensitive channel
MTIALRAALATVTPVVPSPPPAGLPNPPGYGLAPEAPPSPTPSTSPTPSLLLPDSTPGFARDWPGWAQWLMEKPLQILIVVVAATILVAIAHAVINRATQRIVGAPGPGQPADGDPYLAERRGARAATARAVLNSLVKTVVWVLAAGLILERCGVNVAVLVTSIGVVGVGVGLGAQSLIKDMLAGLFMIIEDQYGIGDLIDIGPATGRVEHVSLRVTTVRDEEGVLWYVPNGTIARIGNRSQGRQAGADPADP